MTLEQLMTLEEVADMLHLSKWRIRQLCNQGEIPHIRIGRLFRFKKGSIQAWIDAQKDGGEAE